LADLSKQVKKDQDRETEPPAGLPKIVKQPKADFGDPDMGDWSVPEKPEPASTTKTEPEAEPEKKDEPITKDAPPLKQTSQQTKEPETKPGEQKGKGRPKGATKLAKQQQQAKEPKKPIQIPDIFKQRFPNEEPPSTPIKPLKKKNKF
jgi:hypothetical protein